MFGSISSGVLEALRRNAGATRQAAQTRNDQNAILESIQSDRPREQPRWAQAMQLVGAGMRDVGGALDGRQTGHLNRFNQAQQQMRTAREDARRREARLAQFRDTVPASDRTFWQAYAMGGEEAALGVLQSRHEQENQTHTLSRGEQLVDARGNMIAENRNAAQDDPAIVAALRAAGIDPSSDQGRNVITSHYQRELSPDMAQIAADLTMKVQNGIPLTAEEQAAWERIIEYRRAPDPFASWYGQGGTQTETNDDPLGLRD